MNALAYAFSALALCLSYAAVAQEPEASAQRPALAPARPDWDQAENIREAASRLGKLQEARGAGGAIAFIDACYRTHGLAAQYSRPFEACIAQDYMLTRSLASIYSRLTPQDLAKIGAPAPADLAAAMGRRVVAAFKQYNIPAVEADAFKDLVDKHGVPVLLGILFPNSMRQADPTASASDPKGKGR